MTVEKDQCTCTSDGDFEGLAFTDNRIQVTDETAKRGIHGVCLNGAEAQKEAKYSFPSLFL